VKVLFAMTAALVVTACSTLPPTHDPEGCDRVAEAEKRIGSDLVVDGVLTCVSDEGDCDLQVDRVIASRDGRPSVGGTMSVHILREETTRYGDELRATNRIAFCYPAELWYPQEGRYRGRFYLKQDAQGRFVTAFYPRAEEI
jgi:hypothetical protein